MDVRSRLLAAAKDLLAQHGPGAVRIRDVAAAAGMSTMGVYTHFGSKERLLEEIYADGLAELERRLAAAPAGLLALALEYRRFALDNESLYALMFERALPDFMPSEATRRAGLGAFDQLVSRAGDVQDAHLIWASMHGMVSIELTHRRWGGPVMDHLQADPDATFVSAMETLLDALKRPR
jgi:AcrR family transcriptional regulator